ncbi:MAG: hypothetical protein IJ688_10840 [Treponema sp.]|nr:hypothetical protein [Treponema sp.]
MTDSQWKIFCDFKALYAAKIAEWAESFPDLQGLQKKAAEAEKTPAYSFETPVVYNRALDDITKDDDIKLIVIGDNPGKEEQLACNNRYLVGQAGRIAEGYFRRNPALGVDFRKNVIILNKTPVHSAKTAQLRFMVKQGGQKMAELLEESQTWCARETARLHSELCRAAGEDGIMPELWLVGYSELKKKGIFEQYRDELKAFYVENDFSKYWERVYVFQHFSMNRFTIDLSDYMKKNGCENLPLLESIHSLGIIHKDEIFV